MKITAGAVFLSLMVIFILALFTVSAVIFFFATPEVGTVVSTVAYNATGQIGGFASGQVGQVAYEILTIRTPTGATFNATVGCSFYKDGSTINIISPNPFSSGWSLGKLQTGCYVQG
jgi:hypothetical protein